jgi:PKD domain
MRSRGIYAVLLGVLVALATIVGGTAAYADVPAPGDFAPSIWTDKADYSPGEHVVLSGANWQPGEAVHLVVNDDAGSTWNRTVDVSADAVGNVMDEFDLPDWFVAVYTVHATDASGNTATYSFTDSNVKFTVSPVGATTTIRSTTYANNASCNVTGTPGTASAPTTFSGAASGTVGGVNSGDSAKLTAAATNDQGGTFKNWTGDGINTPVTSTTVCVPGASGNVNVVANYNAAATNAAPAVAATNASVAVDEGTAAGNTGTWSDANASDTVTLSASAGTVTKSGTNASGTWSWSYTPADGPLNSQTVTITASDGTTSTSTTFALVVNNVTPTVTAPANQSANEGTSTSLSIGSFSDPGADGPWSVDVDWGDGGTHTTFTQNTAGSLGSLNHSYSDGPSTKTVTVNVTDKDGASQSKTFSVTVNNVAPVVTAATDQTANEGASTSFNLGSFADPGSDSPWAVDVDWGDGSTPTTFSATSVGTFAAQSHAYANGPATRTITVKVTDKDGASDTKTFKVTVANVAPTVTLSGTNDLSVPEGQTRTYSYTISDPGLDTVASVATSCGSNGTKVGGSDTNTNTTGSFQCTFLDGPATSNVSAAATDSDGGAGTSAMQTVQVTNVAPSIAVTGASTVNEGSTHTYTFTVTDPGQDTFTLDSGYPDCDAGATDNGTLVSGSLSLSGSGGTFQCTFADGPSSANVEVKATDSDGASDSSTQNVDVVTVNNVAPVVTAPADQSASEGSSTSFALGSFTDPVPDANWTVDVDWGDGSTHTTFTKATTGSLGNASHSYADGPATQTVTVTVTDKDGGSDSKTFTVTVGNVAPTTTLAADNAQSVSEGSTHTYSYTVHDPGADTLASVATDCGTNGVKVAEHAGSFECRFPDGDATSVVSATATDSDGGLGNLDTQAVTVANVAPSVTAAADQTADEGNSASIALGSFSDPGADANWSVDVDWGDGSDHTTFDATAVGSLGTQSHIYADGPASHTVTVQVTDKDGVSDSTTFQVDVKNVAPTLTLSTSNATTVDEGSRHTYSYTVHDPGDDTATIDASCGDHGTKSNETAGSFDCTFPDGPDSSDVTATATDSDGATGATDSQTVTVNNVAPTLTLDAGNATTANEGSTHTYRYTVTDPGQDTVGSVHVDCGDNGDKVSESNGSFECKFPDGPSSSDVSAYATDSDGAAGPADTQTVTVENVAPTLALSAANDTTANEGSTHTYSYTVSDPGDDTATVDASCGDKGTKSNETATSFDCTFPDGPASSDVTATATDSDGAAGNTDRQTVTVDNVAPTLTLDTGNATTVDEGSTHTYSYTVSDPGDDTIDHVTTSCGTGGQKVSDSAGSFDCKFADGPASPHVSAYATDSDSAAGAPDSQAVTVNNVAPTVNVSGPANVDEGSTDTYTFTVSDPGDDTFSKADGYPTCDTGTLVAGSYTADATGGSFNCFFADGPSTANVKMRVTDSDGASDTDTQNVQVVAVANVAPSITAPAGQTADEGASKSFDLGSFSDPGTDANWTVDVDWGDGSTSSFTRATDGSLGNAPHTYADGPATETVTVKVTDKDGARDSKTFTIDVNNVAPTATLSSTNDTSANEGSVHTYTYTVRDPGDDTIASVTTSCGANGTKSNETTGSFDCTFPDGPKSSDVSVSATDSDHETGNTARQTVTIANLAPTVVVTGANNADEGQTKTYTFSVTDPGTQDTFTVADGYPDCDAGTTNNGTLVANSLQVTSSGGTFQCFFPDGPASANVKMKVADNDGAADTSSQNVQIVSVANVAPAITAPADQSANEGVSTSLDLGSFTDPGSDLPWAVDVNWGDGSAHTTFNATVAGTLGSQSHTYADGPTTQTVTVIITDKDGVSDTATFKVDVKNVAPTATLGNDGPINEGGSSTIAFSSPSDVGADTAAGLHYAFRCDGSAFPSDPTYAGTSGTASTSCSFPDSGTQTVRARIIDKDDGWHEYTTAVDVHNVAPTVTAPADQGANEGASTSYDLGSFTDPGANDGPWAVDIAWGDGSTHTTFNASSRGALDTKSHTYADNGSYTVTVTVTDKDGGSSSSTFKVSVANVKPTITSFTGTDYLVGNNAFITGGNPLSRLTTAFSDPGSKDTWTALFSFSDGTQTVNPFASGMQTTHTFTSAGCKPVSVTVTDKDGGSDTATTTIHVGTGAFQAPMTDQPVTDKLKNGQVLPVKVHITDCTGAGATTLTPPIRLVAGDATPQNDSSTATITPDSASAADTTGVMRSLGGGDYMYNMKVNLQLNAKYTVVVYPFGTSSPVQLGHVIQATK